LGRGGCHQAVGPQAVKHRHDVRATQAERALAGEEVDQLGVAPVRRLRSEHTQRDVFGSTASARGDSAFEQRGHGALGLADVLSGEQCGVSRGRCSSKWLLQQGLQVRTKSWWRRAPHATGLAGRSRRRAS